MFASNSLRDSSYPQFLRFSSVPQANSEIFP
jgi:hypothetical protein